MVTSIDELLKLKEEYQKRVREEGEGVLKLMFKDFFESNPQIDSVRWTQYTPYFNDGEPCEFGVGDAGVKVKDVNVLRENLRDSRLSKDIYESRESTSRWGGREHVKTGSRPYTDEELMEGGDREDGYYESWHFKENSSLNVPLGNLNGLLQRSSDILEMVLGDHVQVTVTRDSIETEEYNHD